jgi:CRISPR/Cas system-associated exonuclease Cas4 (RecB family)
MTLQSALLDAAADGLRKERSVRGVHLDPSTLGISGRASSLNKDCLRALWYESRGVERAPLPFTAEVVFATGRFWHEQVRAWLAAKGVVLVDVEREVRYREGGLDIIGHVDGVIVYEGKRYLLDIKSASDYGFKTAEEAGKGSYARQLALYAAALAQMGAPVDGAILLYIAKGRGEPSGIMTARGTTDDIGNVVKAVELSLADLPTDAVSRLDAVRAEEPPAPLPPAADKDGQEIVVREYRAGGEKRAISAAVWPWQCAYCPFVKTCRPEAKGALLRSSQRKEGVVRYLQEETSPRGPYDKFVLYSEKKTGG